MTHSDAPNLVLAGKTMAQSFYANAITRLHPSEWSSGAAAALAAEVSAAAVLAAGGPPAGAGPSCAGRGAERSVRLT